MSEGIALHCKCQLYAPNSQTSVSSPESLCAYLISHLGYLIISNLTYLKSVFGSTASPSASFTFSPMYLHLITHTRNPNGHLDTSFSFRRSLDLTHSTDLIPTEEYISVLYISSQLFTYPTFSCNYYNFCTRIPVSPFDCLFFWQQFTNLLKSCFGTNWSQNQTSSMTFLLEFHINCLG